MKKYLYFALAALISVTLASCEKTPEPVPDPEPQPTENVVNVTLNAFTVEDYFEEDGDYTLIFLGSDDNNVVYYAQFDILPETATILGTYSLAAKTMGSEYSAFLINYTDNSTQDDLVAPDTMSVTVTANGGNYDIKAEIVYAGVTYALSAANLSAIDPAWQYEPTTATTINQTYTAFDGIDYTADYQTVSIFLENEETFVSLELLANEALPAGTYPVSDTYEVGTAVASEGFNADYEYDTPSFLGVYTDADGHYDATYYFVDGQVVVSYPEDGKIAIAGSATSYYGSTVTFSYEGAYAWQTDDDTEESPAALSKKLQAKASAHAAKLLHKPLTSLAARK